MTVIYETVKILFVLCTLVLGFLLLQGDILFPQQSVHVLQKTLLPGYLFLAGIIFSYILLLTSTREHPTEKDAERMRIRIFLLGVGLGCLLALVSIFTL